LNPAAIGALESVPAVNASLRQNDNGLSLIAARRNAARTAPSAESKGTASGADARTAAENVDADATAKAVSVAVEESAGDTAPATAQDRLQRMSAASEVAIAASYSATPIMPIAPAGGGSTPSLPDNATQPAPRPDLYVAPKASGWKRRTAFPKIEE
jgi:hypothetical protein